MADLRAPTPTAAAELVSASAESYLRGLDEAQARLRLSLTRYLQREAQHVDHLAARIGRPTLAMGRQRGQLDALQQGMQHALRMHLQRQQALCGRAELRLQAIDPALVLQRGYAWLTHADGRPITRARQIQVGQKLVASLADGAVDLQAHNVRAN